MADAHEEYDRGNELWHAGRIEEAARRYEEAVHALTPADDDLAPDLYENLGVALWQLGRHRPALRALYRVLDGDLGARQQSLRLAVSCCFRIGRTIDGARLLAEYETRFGPHPEGWNQRGISASDGG